jgi:hypothetical protein
VRVSAVQNRRTTLQLVRRVLGSVAASLAAMTLLPAAAASAGTAASGAPAASAASGPQFWVSPTGTSTGQNTNCATAGYSTIQSAVVAAESVAVSGPGDLPTIQICPGTYTEQITITTSMVLTRAPVGVRRGPVTIQLPASVGDNQQTGLSTTDCQAKDAAANIQVPQSVVEICAAKPGGTNTTGVHVSISQVTIVGNWPTTVCYNSLYGVLVGGGASLSLTDSVVSQIGAFPLNGCQGGVGVEAGFAPTGQVGHATLSNDTIETYQKNGITIDGAGSTAKISSVTVTGDGPTDQIAQNGIQISFGATASVTGSLIGGNNYTGSGEASATGILVVGGGGSACGIGKGSPLVKRASLDGNTLTNNDIGIALFNVNSACTKSATTPTRDRACGNIIRNTHGYPGNEASVDANISGLVTTKYGAIGDQAGVSDSGDKDVICHNVISGQGYAPRDKTSSLPNPRPPAWVRPIDLFSFAPARAAKVYGNTYNGKKYHPS